RVFAMSETRREFLKSIAAPKLPTIEAPIKPPNSDVPLPLPAPAPSLAVHAANRLMFGPKPGDIDHISTVGYSAFLEEQLNPAAIDDSACDALLNALPHETFSETRAQLFDRREMDYYSSIAPILQTRYATVTRMVNSKRQLFERMVEFWHNHFNVFGFDYIIQSMFSDWDKLIRTHALGNFRQFLEATTRHPCMLYYLDQYISTDGGPNENYSRELLELQTLGAINYRVPGGYEDEDVYETSRCLTGWTFDYDSQSANRGNFKYIDGDHDRFQKFVLGKQIPSNQPPQKDGTDLLDLVANHPGTALHIARKLWVRFISDSPDNSACKDIANVFIAAKSQPDQILRTLRALLNHAAFTGQAYRKMGRPDQQFENCAMVKFKRPIDWVVSTMRALGIPYVAPTDNFNFDWIYDPMGMSMFGWRPPNGPPDLAVEWANSNNFMRRWNFIFPIAAGWYDGTGFTYSVTGIMPGALRTPREIATFWVQRILGRTPSEATQNALVDFVADGRDYDTPISQEQIDDKLPHLAALCTVTPEFMRR
ncbi:MAG: DUF1800 domain-containing protein, partial [Candidatus Sumerlaeaceae bacterium]|nr:DUF1800 domain-containing protein [Candidatus Sumerlaeaceae bacterium]